MNNISLLNTLKRLLSSNEDFSLLSLELVNPFKVILNEDIGSFLVVNRYTNEDISDIKIVKEDTSLVIESNTKKVNKTHKSLYYESLLKVVKRQAIKENCNSITIIDNEIYNIPEFSDLSQSYNIDIFPNKLVINL